MNTPSSNKTGPLRSLVSTNAHLLPSPHLTQRHLSTAAVPATTQAAAAKPHSSTLLPLRATTRRPAALRVVAFREDDRQSQIKRGTRDAKNQARNVANQGKQQLQKGKNNINRRKWRLQL